MTMTETGAGHAGDAYRRREGQTNTVPDLGAADDAPPAYGTGDHLDQLQLSQAGFEAGAAVTEDGRVNININQKNRRLADLLAPTIRSQLLHEAQLPSGPLPPAYIPPSLGGQPGQTPPPQLNVVIQIVGSRGDVQPFVALGQVLRDTYGHRVRIATHATFQKFVEENGLEFFSIGGDPAELMAFMVKNPGLMPGLDALKSGEIKKRRQGIEEIVAGCWRSCIEAGNGLGPPLPQHRPEEPVDERFVLPGDPADRPFIADAIIANPPSFAHIHIAEKLGIPLHIMFTMPWSPTRAFPHPLANIESTNTDVVMTNYVSYAMVEMMTWQGLGDVINRFRTKILDLEPLSLIWAPGLLNRLRVPTTYCWSSALIPKPADWATEITISGFFFLNLASSYTPEPDLAAFLAAGPPPVYIGFGSIVVDNPNALTRMIFDAVSATGVRALVSKGWGGLGADSVGIPEGVFMLGNCPHDWLFQHVSAVVHHGGAGTSAAGIKAGKPTVVVPFFGDQPFWGSMINRAGAGPAPIPYKRLTAGNLAAAIQECLKPETQVRAQELGAKIREEKGADVGGKSFHEFLNTDNMRCALAPSRVAIWRVRRTKIRLSALAATVLVKQGLLKYSDLKLYRSVEYNTEEQPWDPISAVTSALVGDIGNIAMAMTDFPRDIFTGGDRKKSNSNADASGSALPSGENRSAESLASVPSSTSQKAAGTRSDMASMASSSHPSVIVSEPSTIAGASQSSLTGVTSPLDTNLSPQRTRGNSFTRRPSSRGDGDSSPPTPNPPMNLENAIGAGRGVSRIVDTSMKMPMNFCLGLARGFRNAPRLYNDETVRPTEKVTDFASGLKVAGKEFGLGFYDGLAGLVTQPLKGAEKEGGMGLLKGFGKGLGGLVLKPAAAIWALPAYTMQGVHAEVRNIFSRSSQNYIITARVLQGKEDLQSSTVEEQRDILIRWQARRDELRRFYLLKQKGDKSPAASSGTPQVELEGDAPPRTGWLHTRNMSMEDRKKLHAQRDAWKKRQVDLKVAGRTNSGGLGKGGGAFENEEFERAIQASVQQTSRGDKDEDARVEAAIRASVKEMRKIAEHSRDFKAPIPDDNTPTTWTTGQMPGDDHWTDITDEEYQALIEQAVQQSLSQQQAGVRSHVDDTDTDDEELRRAIEESTQYQQQSGVGGGGGGGGGLGGLGVIGGGSGGGDDDEEMRKALEESERAHRMEMERQKTEEEIVLEYVKKQSLAEAEFRRKGKAVARDDDAEEDDDDEDLRRALEESLRVHGGGGGGGGGSRGAGPSTIRDKEYEDENTKFAYMG
ncbi:glycosyltransferase family 28 domain-containing protein [Diplogelasinospora grovesii]|uniref:Glycosyltransferase family 28 domain-containing protein n=1 Tax=Diplogelasinospora grovesii TaxID=303347 RepID=A0AAN6N9G8_9PEZI|nr:glycosyltransferase family 28 domain-containing protein [Diplogelasinospora grovesii]